MKKQKLDHRGASIGNMRNRIILHDSIIKAPLFGSVDFDEDFQGLEAWAAIKSVSGKVLFDSVGVGQEVTHEVFIRYDYNVNAETYVQVDDGRRFKVLSVEDFEERHEYMRLLCTERGFNEAAKV